MSQNIIDLSTKLYFLSDADFYYKDYAEMLSSILQTIILKENDLDPCSKEDCSKISDFNYLFSLLKKSENQYIKDFLKNTDEELLREFTKDYLEKIKEFTNSSFSDKEKEIIETNINTRIFLKYKEHPHNFKTNELEELIVQNTKNHVLTLDLNETMFLPEELELISNGYKLKNIKKLIVKNILDKDEFSEIINTLETNGAILS